MNLRNVSTKIKDVLSKFSLVKTDTKVKDKDKNSTNLLPEFIYGYVPANDKIDFLIKNPNYRREHDYENDGLLYDLTAFYKQKKETSLKR